MRGNSRPKAALNPYFSLILRTRVRMTDAVLAGLKPKTTDTAVGKRAVRYSGRKLRKIENGTFGQASMLCDPLLSLPGQGRQMGKFCLTWSAQFRLSSSGGVLTPLTRPESRYRDLGVALSPSSCSRRPWSRTRAPGWGNISPSAAPLIGAPTR